MSWGQALWRKDKESGLTDFCATYQSLVAGEPISEAANDVLLPGLIALSGTKSLNLSLHCYEVDIRITFVLQMRKQRHQEMK